MKLTSQQRDALLLGAIGIFVTFGYGLIPIDFGGKSISSSDAWARGLAQPYVTAGGLLIVLAFFHARNAAWVRWPIILWCPITFCGGMLWSISQGAAQFDAADFAVIVVPVLLIWVWATYRMSSAESA